MRRKQNKKEDWQIPFLEPLVSKFTFEVTLEETNRLLKELIEKLDKILK